jgi:hypothetical protein
MTKKRKRRLGAAQSGPACKAISKLVDGIADNVEGILDVCGKVGDRACNDIIVPGYPFEQSLDEVETRNWALKIKKMCP